MNEMMTHLPCLRCGEKAIIVPFLFPRVGRDVLKCQNCDEFHYLRVTRKNGYFDIAFYVYTLRYPLEHYDESDPPYGRLKTSITENIDRQDSMFLGPVTVYPRKKRYSKSEILQIWESSNKKCHICKKSWKLIDRGLYGWHIDHIVPNAGGRYGTENLKNFKVACAKCNLKKGRGYTTKKIHLALRKLILFFEKWEDFDPSNREAWQKLVPRKFKKTRALK